MFCKTCGKELKPNAKFCSGCGQKIQLSMPNPEPVVPEEEKVVEMSWEEALEVPASEPVDEKIPEMPIPEPIEEVPEIPVPESVPEEEEVVPEMPVPEPAVPEDEVSEETVLLGSTYGGNSEQIQDDTDATVLIDGIANKDSGQNICPSCGNKLVPGAKFCNKCGQLIGGGMANESNHIDRRPPVNTSMPPVMPELDKMKKMPKENKAPKNKAPKDKTPKAKPQKSQENNGMTIAMIAIVVVLVLAIIGGGAIFWFQGGKDIITSKTKSTSKKTEKEIDSKDDAEDKNGGTDGTDESEEVAEGNELDESKQEIFNYLVSSVTEDTDRDELERTLENVISFAKENNAGEYVTEHISDVYDIYLSSITDSLNNLETQDARPAIYIQMKSDIEDAIEMSEKLEAADINVDYNELKDKQENLSNYKELLIKEFDKVAEETINQNGAISRSSMWSVMENCDKTDLFSKSDVEDELNIRYMIALALHVDNELEKMSEQEAVKELRDKIRETDYNPLLVYYLAETYKDSNAKECLNFINSVIPEFANGDIAQKRNFIYYYKDKADARKEIREYMQGHF